MRYQTALHTEKVTRLHCAYALTKAPSLSGGRVGPVLTHRSKAGSRTQGYLAQAARRTEKFASFAGTFMLGLADCSALRLRLPR